MFQIVLVLVALASSFIIGSRVIKNGNDNTVKPQKEPVSTSIPIVRTSPTTGKITKTPTYTFRNNPTPTFDPDPLVKCSTEKCGERIVKKSVCANSVCCHVSTDKWEYKDTTECREIIKNSYSNNTQNSVVVTTSQSYQISEYERVKLLEDCRDRARETYKQASIGSQTGKNYGEVVGESQDIRNKLNKALQQCNNLYGG